MSRIYDEQNPVPSRPQGEEVQGMSTHLLFDALNECIHVHFGILMMQVQRLCPSRTNEAHGIAGQ